MSDKPRQIQYLKDYRPPAHRVERVELTFQLHEEETLVASVLAIRPNPAHPDPHSPLRLHARELELLRLELDGRELTNGEGYHWDGEEVTLTVPDAPCVVKSLSRIQPARNTSLEGLYLSNGKYCTQCEPEGFRKITPYLDRPDVMAPFSVRIEADRERYPQLLSNGNPKGSGELPDGRHFVQWEDPFPKPSYLFALVAGDFHCQEARFTTLSGREITLRLYVEHPNADQCDHALESLTRAMRWDEERFGREYDLELYQIVAVGDFNMGAMENKGLNVFNAKYVLAKPATATDGDYFGIESVIAHEYFHNWTGNRITCRDWFQLSLKEGLTVFRDQLFSADQTSPALQRIRDVRYLSTVQFAEDAGPTAHPVQPASYMEINNFYTATVYNKGAELARMLYVLLGRAGFRRGMDLYFDRYDGQAVTVEELAGALEEANGVDLEQFRLWYRQAGTPRVAVRREFDPREGTLTLVFQQSCPPTPGQPHKEPFHIPVAMGLIGGDGQPLPLHLAGEPAPMGTHRVLELRGEEERFTFVGLTTDTPPVPSLLRNFSAPVKLTSDLDTRELAFLWAHDTDPFNRWEASQILATRLLLERGATLGAGGRLEPLPDSFVTAFHRTLEDEGLDPALVAQALTLPSVAALMEELPRSDPVALWHARQESRKELAQRLLQPLHRVYRTHRVGGSYRYDPLLAARRALRNLCLEYLVISGDGEGEELAREQLGLTDNMSDRLGALAPLAEADGAAGRKALEGFYHTWRDHPLVVDKWLTLHAMVPAPDALARVKGLLTHPAYSPRNPNKVRALVGAFAAGNPVRFHDASGEGYRFLAEQVLEQDGPNPQLAARLVQPLTRWRRLEPARSASMREALRQVAEHPGLSRDTFEMASKGLAPAE